MFTLGNNNCIKIDNAAFDHELVVYIADEANNWQRTSLTKKNKDTFECKSASATVNLELEPQDGFCKWQLNLDSSSPVRVILALETPNVKAPFHIIPCVIYGDNNLDKVARIIFPHLTTEDREEVNCTSHWEFRADRASHPVAITTFEGGIGALAIDPYCDDAINTTGPTAEEFVRNGVFASLDDGNQPCACGVTLGYRNSPLTYVNKGRFYDPTQHCLSSGSASGTLHLMSAEHRSDVHRVFRDLHALYRDPADAKLNQQEGIDLIRKGISEVGWIPEERNAADLKWDFENQKLISLRGPNDEIAWTGGTQTAYPLLVSAHRAGDQGDIDKAMAILDRVGTTESINPKSGWLWDVCGDNHGRDVNGWWVHAVGQNHCAYTNAEALTYLLHAYKYARNEMQIDKQAWLEVVLKVLDKAISVQMNSGNFGYTYSIENGEIVDPEGFAGCWMVPALTMANELTGDPRYLKSAEKAMAFYSKMVRNLCAFGTPMDTSKAIDQEGVLSFIRGARLLHEVTGDPCYLDMLEQGAEFEYTWRFVFRARPQEPPLKDSSWNSCGGSITSTSNPHIHPMGILVSGDLKYLATQTGDSYHQQRLEEGLMWALNSLSLYPDEMGYGCAGILTERFCPSDGLLTERYPDESVASVWFTHHVWGAANALEGLLEVELT